MAAYGNLSSNGFGVALNTTSAVPFEFATEGTYLNVALDSTHAMFTVAGSGAYLVTYNVSWSIFENGQAYFYLYKNGSIISDGYSGLSIDFAASGSAIIQLTASDQIQLMASADTNAFIANGVGNFTISQVG